jgi:hypothetical protein
MQPSGRVSGDVGAGQTLKCAARKIDVYDFRAVVDSATGHKPKVE